MALGAKRCDFGTAQKAWSRSPWRLSAKLLIASSVATVIGFFPRSAPASCSTCVTARKELARQTLENLASSIDAEISRNVELYDLSLRAVCKQHGNAGDQGRQQADPASDPVRSCRDRRNISARFQVFDADGRLIIDASTLDPVSDNRSDEEFFQIHHDRTDAGLFISRPMLHHGGLCHCAEPAYHQRRRRLFSAWSWARSAFPIFMTCSAA